MKVSFCLRKKKLSRWWNIFILVSWCCIMDLSHSLCFCSMGILYFSVVVERKRRQSFGWAVRYSYLVPFHSNSILSEGYRRTLFTTPWLISSLFHLNKYASFFKLFNEKYLHVRVRSTVFQQSRSNYSKPKQKGENLLRKLRDEAVAFLYI